MMSEKQHEGKNNKKKKMDGINNVKKFYMLQMWRKEMPSSCSEKLIMGKMK
jgi:hypothetical protein